MAAAARPPATRLTFLLSSLFHFYPVAFLSPGHRLQSGSPDVRCSLLHQKLQMLHCCIERKRARSLALLSGAPSAAAAAKATDASRGDGDASDDEFFECVDAPAAAAGESAEPIGRLEALELSDEEKQLVGGQSPIFVPVTQEPAPLTEDAIEQTTSILEKWAIAASLSFTVRSLQTHTRIQECMPRCL